MFTLIILQAFIGYSIAAPSDQRLTCYDVVGIPDLKIPLYISKRATFIPDTIKMLIRHKDVLSQDANQEKHITYLLSKSSGQCPEAFVFSRLTDQPITESKIAIEFLFRETLLMYDSIQMTLEPKSLPGTHRIAGLKDFISLPISVSETLIAYKEAGEQVSEVKYLRPLQEGEYYCMNVFSHGMGLFGALSDPLKKLKLAKYAAVEFSVTSREGGQSRATVEDVAVFGICSEYMVRYFKTNIYFDAELKGSIFTLKIQDPQTRAYLKTMYPIAERIDPGDAFGGSDFTMTKIDPSFVDQTSISYMQMGPYLRFIQTGLDLTECKINGLPAEIIHRTKYGYDVSTDSHCYLQPSPGSGIWFETKLPLQMWEDCKRQHDSWRKI